MAASRDYTPWPDIFTRDHLQQKGFPFNLLGHSNATTILSIISAMNIHGKMTFANKVLLALSVTFQITGQLWPMVVTSMLAIVDRHPLSASQAALLLLRPFVTHWTGFV